LQKREKREEDRRNGRPKSAGKAATAEEIERELLRRFHASRSTRTFGYRLKEIRRGRVALEMKVQRRFLQAHGRVHGGVIAALADTAAAFAAYTSVPARSRLVTLEMKINFLEGASQGTLSARGHLIRLGKNIAVSESDVKDDGGRLIAKALVTVAVAAPLESSR
jgi:uncharacterized protein (TIGR00369 family)